MFSVFIMPQKSDSFCDKITKKRESYASLFLFMQISLSQNIQHYIGIIAGDQLHAHLYCQIDQLLGVDPPSRPGADTGGFVPLMDLIHRDRTVVNAANAGTIGIAVGINRVRLH